MRNTTAPLNPRISSTTTNLVSALVVRRITGRCSMPVDLLSYTDNAQPSMNPHFRQLGQSELLPRYIFAESLITRRRVLEVGGGAATNGRSALFLLQRGALSVVACDADLRAIEQAQKELSSPQLRFRANEFEDFEPGEFEAVLIADLAPYVRAPQLLKKLAR